MTFKAKEVQSTSAKTTSAAEPPKAEPPPTPSRQAPSEVDDGSSSNSSLRLVVFLNAVGPSAITSATDKEYILTLTKRGVNVQRIGRGFLDAFFVPDHNVLYWKVGEE